MTAQEVCFSALNFLKQYEWLFDFPATKILLNDTLEKIPQEWINAFQESENNLISFLASNFENHPSLSEFFKQCRDYSVESDYLNSTFGLTKSLVSFDEPTNGIIVTPKHLSPKKSHEVPMLVELIGQIGKTVEAKKCLDIGSGLGYLGCALHQNLGYNVACVENDCKKILSAKDLQKEIIGDCPSAPSHFNCHIGDNDSSFTEIKKIIKNLESQDSFCKCLTENRSLKNCNNSVMLISLHSCADLSPLMLEMFTRINTISAIISLPCCYHKLKVVPEAQECNFENKREFLKFPMSSTMRELFSKINFSFNICALRLASDKFSQSWRNQPSDHIIKDIQNLLFRAILEKVCHQNGIVFKKGKRRLQKFNDGDFDSYIKSVLDDGKFFTNSGEKSEISLECLKKQLYNAFLADKDKLSLIGLIKIFQLSIQPVLEVILFMDYFFFLKESGFEFTGLVQLFNKKISPRNIAVIALRSEYIME